MIVMQNEIASEICLLFKKLRRCFLNFCYTPKLVKISLFSDLTRYGPVGFSKTIHQYENVNY